MSQIVLDISANTHRNDEKYYKHMINELAKVDTRKHNVVLKWQLWAGKLGENKTPDSHLFYEMAWWAWEKYEYKTTASIFDISALGFLDHLQDKMNDSQVGYKLPFIKIANRRELDWLVGEIPRKYKIYKSVGDMFQYDNEMFTFRLAIPLYCVSEYPAPVRKYPDYVKTISDHTVGLNLWLRNRPHIWEKHYKLSDSAGLDAGDFAITPEELKEIL